VVLVKNFIIVVTMMNYGTEQLTKYTLDKTTRAKFIAHLTNKGKTRIRKKQYVGWFNKIHNFQLGCQAAYGALAPILFIIGVFVHTLLFPFYLDNVIEPTTKNYWRTFIVFLTTVLPSYLVMALGLVTEQKIL
jgi:hypothetical protein